MPQNNKPILILGAGITGLTLAYYLKKANKNLVLLDIQPKTGGVINTKHENGFLYESGPNSGVLGNVETVQLFKDLGNAVQLEKANPVSKERRILKNGKWYALPSGLWSAINTPLFSWYDKIRILGEPFRAKGNNPDETLAEMVCRRMGKSFLDYAVDPFIIGIYAGNPHALIPKYALPKLYRLEQEHGSFIKGSMAKARLKKTALEKEADRNIFSTEGGLSNLVKALEQAIGKEHFVLNIQNPILYYNEHTQRYKLNYTHNQQDHTLESTTVVSTFGGDTLKDVLTFTPPQHLNNICNMPYAGVIEAGVGFKTWQGIDLKAFGGLIPHKEKENVLGILFMSSIFNNRAPKNGALFSLFLGGVRQAHLLEADDETITKHLADFFTQKMGLTTFNPDLLHLKRIKKAIPQYTIQSKERLMSIAAMEEQYQGLHLAGNIRDGIGMADRIKQGADLAKEIIERS